MNSISRLLMIGALLPFLFLSQSCEKIKDEIEKEAAFDVSIDMPTESIDIDSATYKSSDGIQEWKILKEYSVAVDLQKILDDNDLSSAEFRDGKYETATARIIYPEGLTFSFLDRMYIALSLNPNFDPEVKVAETDNIPAGATSAVFNIVPTDITSFIEAPVFYVRVYGNKVTTLPTTLVVLDIESKVKVTVEPKL